MFLAKNIQLLFVGKVSVKSIIPVLTGNPHHQVKYLTGWCPAIISLVVTTIVDRSTIKPVHGGNQLSYPGHHLVLGSPSFRSGWELYAASVRSRFSCVHMEVSIVMGVPKNRWTILENPTKMDELGVPPF